MSAVLELRLANRLSEIRRVAERIESFCAIGGVPESVIFKLNLALDEVLTNIIDYAYDEEGEHEIILRVVLVREILSAEVVDDGRPYDPTLTPDPDTGLSLDDRPIGGLGIYFAKRMMDRVVYVRDGNRNRLTLSKSTGKGADEAG
ncbi:MAG: ATP-binding protein [Rhodospirillaceae bacterium]